jgi:hypothetical protein
MLPASRCADTDTADVAAGSQSDLLTDQNWAATMRTHGCVCNKI